MLNNQIILVTGGAGRIGSAFCKGIIENRGKVIIGDISEEKGMALEKYFQCFKKGTIKNFLQTVK